MLEKIHCVLIWSPWLRLSHWLIAAGTLFQILSAWALKHDSVNHMFWLDWHIISGQIILMALVLRMVLLFVPGSSNWRAFFPEKVQRHAMLQMVKFYLSLARFPLPNWHAHNPLWLPLYPVFFLVLAGSAMTGLFYDSRQNILGYSMHALHYGFTYIIIIFSMFHIVSVVLHDLKGKGAFISAMINGHRYFHFNGQNNKINDLSMKNKTEKKSFTVTVDSIKKHTNQDKD